MDLERFFCNNVVLEVDSTAEHQAFLCRYFFTYLLLLALAGKKLDKPLLYVIDEGQILSTIKHFGQKILSLRHLGVMLSINFQDASRAPIELSGNCNVQISFQGTDQRDRDAFAQAANLTREQADVIKSLRNAECVCSMVRGEWKSPFIAKVEELEFVNVSDGEIARRSQKFLKQFPYVPVQETGEAIAAPKAGEKSPIDANASKFMHDVLNQAHEYSPIGKRWERAGIRSASMQQRILKRLAGEGFIKIYEMAMGKGGHWKFVEPTKKAFEEFEVEAWRPSGRGNLPTRVATQYLFQQLKKLEGWQCVKEGNLAGHQVDLLCREEDGRAVSIEIAGNPGHEVHNAIAVLSETTKHYVVCVSEEVKEKVKKNFSECEELRDCEKISVIAISEALGEKWEP